MRSRPLGAAFFGAAMGFGLATSASAKTLVFCSEGSPEIFNPQLTVSATAQDAAGRTIYNRLVEFEPGTTNIKPALAESWAVSDDGLEYTFKLREGVKFHETPWFTPTRDLNVDDVIFSFERMWKADHPYHDVSGGTYEYFNSMGF